MANITKVIFRLISRSIIDDNPNDVTKYLNKLPLESVPPDRTDIYLNNILVQCLNLNRNKCCKAVMRRFFKLNISENTFSTFCQMFSSMKFSERLLSFVMKSHPKESFLNLAGQYIDNADSDENLIGLKRMDEVFGDQSLETYEILFTAAYENESDSIANYLAERVANFSPYSNVPTWVKDFSDEKELPIETEFYIPWVYNKVLEIKESNYIKLINVKLRRQDVENTEHDVNIFRILGPPNPPIRTSIPLASRNTVYDGPRMFICDQYDYDDDDIPSDWFQGSCEQCLMKIRQRWHAVRKPKAGGGWIGSYCSFSCMRYSEVDENWLIMQMIDDLEELMNEIGIQDRKSAVVID